MTERKPPGVDWQTWIDRQIEEGRAQGLFDELPGHGKPLPGIDRPRDELWWVREKLRREGVEHLPPSLAIRKQATDAQQRAMEAASEGDVRRIIEEINEEIRQLNRLSIDGPPTTLMPFDVDEVVEAWRRRTPEPERSSPDETAPGAPTTDEGRRPSLRTRLRRRLGRPGGGSSRPRR